MNTADNTATLETRLREQEAQREGTYDKRTEHLDTGGRAIFINRLIEEDSPYLLQHAHNPVNWYPWGDEAFAAAQAQDKPIFLSIGYSTCHWCHVMEVESFDNVEVAKLLNQHFISIKMDREQFPDLDEIYMTGVQLVSGHGGWPMSNFLRLTAGHFTGLPISRHLPSCRCSGRSAVPGTTSGPNWKGMPIVSIRPSIKSCVSASRWRPSSKTS